MPGFHVGNGVSPGKNARDKIRIVIVRLVEMNFLGLDFHLEERFRLSPYSTAVNVNPALIAGELAADFLLEMVGENHP